MQSILQEQLGNMDVYLFDQIMKGRLNETKTILDAGCGSGRNLYYFIKNHFDVYGIDSSEEAIDSIRSMYQSIAPFGGQGNFTIENIENLPFEDLQMDTVVCNAVLHFAADNNHFKSMIDELWRVLNPKGILFIRTASSIGIENIIDNFGQSTNGRYLLPDESIRYLVSMEQLLSEIKRLDATLLDPIKTTNVHNLRAMTTLVLKKNKPQ